MAKTSVSFAGQLRGPALAGGEGRWLGCYPVAFFRYPTMRKKSKFGSYGSNGHGTRRYRTKSIRHVSRFS